MLQRGRYGYVKWNEIRPNWVVWKSTQTRNDSAFTALRGLQAPPFTRVN
ncbi:hypothetical protein C8J46_10916 [Sphingomonas sp. PP-F2F-A104-K0414]|nr:hypothetical protein C8J46_10916 [Sphingomonas sp. PP-F2F-A104-K0414]